MNARERLNSRAPLRGPVGIGFAVLLAVAIVAAFLPRENERVVTATAYNSLPSQTDDLPNLGAWEDEIRPGMAVIAVSQDLVEAGLDRGTTVRVEGFDEEFVVLDRMHSRWENKIDIYMGTDVEAAREFGSREVRIYW